MTPTATLLLRLAAPLQSWGDHRAVLDTRHTAAQPSKSGVIGLLAASLGRDLDEPLGPLADLTMGVRADVPGTLLRDYHTVSDYRGAPLLSANLNAKGRQKPTSKARYVQPTERFYLQDAAFLVGVNGPADFMEELTAAAKAPACLLGLGRRSCPPTFPFVLGLTDTPLTDALSERDWLASPHARTVWQNRNRGAAPAGIDVPATIEDPDGDTVLNDQPTGFALGQRRHTTRRVSHRLITLATGFAPGPDTPAGGEHDPLALLGW
ncbi:type I-E CRISPR-associated protein Cas5/CasD [Streptomyces sp. NBC_01754]|uniref:type I-E CRISPR-associated protein Cas5/CasD n=1 Tax=Streptomyces sp. NBC_01754 TaxID=2975930 RepID=UPI002DD85563|nr:type I-E CRISPR-associated protein Cas5/CasD [Streptomyces sp. NBC_01754]WSC91238.1 type I-E CRISPR-associated protein Cas5/CasD [Streptomyces sp. NBC_01754]